MMMRLVSAQGSMDYHIECESRPGDGTILVRMFEYGAQIALDNSEQKGDRLHVRFAHSGLLLPFYLFRYEKELPQYEDDRESLTELLDRYRMMCDRLGECVQKGIGDLMGGRVLDLDIIKARRAGREEGIEQGIEQGYREGHYRLH